MLRYLFKKNINFFSETNNSLIFTLIIFSTLIKYQAPNGKLRAEEEMYFGFGMMQISEELNQNSSFGFEEINSRYFFNILTTESIKHFGYENTQRIGRLISSILYSIALAYFFKVINLNIFQFMICLLLFINSGQDFFGGEWFFHSFHPKTIAYPLLFLALSFIIRNKFFEAIICLSITTYTHFQIGGWFFIYLLTFMVVQKLSLKSIFKYFAIYLIITSPFILSILQGYFSIVDLSSYKNLPDVDWIYAAFRHPHHTAPFLNFSWFLSRWITGIFMSIPFVFLTLRIYQISKFKIYKNLALLNIIILAQLYICLIIAFFDQSYFLGKFYIFRSSGMALFLSIILSVFWINSIVDKKSTIHLNLFIFSILFITHIINYPYKIIQMTRKPHNEAGVLMAYIEKNTESKDVILIDSKIENKLLHFERITKRPTLVTRTFIPTTKAGILEWYKRIQFKNQIFNVDEPNEKYEYSYLITSGRNLLLDKNYGDPVFIENYIIYKNSKETKKQYSD